jgi:hypothetical protein
MAIYDAYVTVRYKVQNICADEDCDAEQTPEMIARGVIESEGIGGVADDAGEILSVQLVAVGPSLAARDKGSEEASS